MSLDLATYCGRGKVAGTKRALKALGALVQAPTNSWEVLRFKTKFGVGIVHQNKKGELTGSEGAMAALQHIAAGRTDPIAPKVKRKKERPERAVALRASVMIFADASLCSQTGAGGWGAWMKADSLPAKTCGGAMKELFAHSSHAETAALANALHAAKARGYLQAGAVVMLQSDNLIALGAIAKGVGGKDSPMRDLADGVAVVLPKRPAHLAIQRCVTVIGKLVHELQLQIIVRHVRGHQTGADEIGNGRAYVNNTCDAIAKDGMRAARAALSTAKRSTTTEPAQEAAL